ncbi:Na(+)/citrate cotransporter-like [Tachypleus tridentatus]|uniref:Na(+)/citrate cotransporter-like n=1 Tax=Tachypleus tridentatus TaxID=6853 RepID=UPI003FD3B222
MIGLGGILVAIAVEHCNLHQRIALRVLLSVGTTPRWLMLGFMMTSSTLSMWIGPTPTVAMMIPIVDAVLKELDNSIDLPGFDTPTPDREGSELGDSTEALNVLHIECQTPQEQNVRKLRNVMMLTMCYAANVGGAGTLPATAPNLVFKFVLEDLYPSFGGVSFTTWMVFNTPGIILCVGIIWFLTVFFVLRKIPQTSTHEQQSQVKNFIRLKYKELGSWTFHQISVIVLFTILAILWLFRNPEFMKGWETLIPVNTKIDDATSTLLVGTLLFIVPANPWHKSARIPLLDWKTAEAKMPWGVLLLIGGGFSLAEGVQKSGLSTWLGGQLGFLENFPEIVVVLFLSCFMLVFIEIAGNTAAATIILPVIGDLASKVHINPLAVMLPAAISCSFAFMFPVSSGPTALVFEGAKMKIKDMILPGIIAKIICLLVTLLMVNTLGVVMFHVNTFPDWANNTHVDHLS